MRETSPIRDLAFYYYRQLTCVLLWLFIYGEPFSTDYLRAYVLSHLPIGFSSVTSKYYLRHFTYTSLDEGDPKSYYYHVIMQIFPLISYSSELHRDISYSTLHSDPHDPEPISSSIDVVDFSNFDLDKLRISLPAELDNAYFCSRDNQIYYGIPGGDPLCSSFVTKWRSPSKS